ncbi:MAG TPA: response regulator transcription factor [Ignavibacteria bacterium]|nr:response regulator transcription factor [Ignavibacteria bacterium]
MSEIIKIIIADDHPVFRSGLKQIIESDDNLKVLAEAEDGQRAYELLLHYKPNVLVLDIDMPKKTGLEVLKEIKKNKINVRTILLTMYKEEDIFDEAMNLGVDGYILKESAISDIIECINAVFNNKHYISPLISDYILNRNRRKNQLKSKFPAIDVLTTAERKILKLVAENKTSKEIADELFISYRTVENHRTNISSKLNLHGTHSLVKFAIENKALL